MTERIIGFTGTRMGMTTEQKKTFRSVPFSTIHHGDCIGADYDAHLIALEYNKRIEIWPPINEKYRAFCKDADIIHKSHEYLDRNKLIVNNTDSLIATPGEYVEIARSGTWSTIRYARKVGKSVLIIYPNGGVEE